MQQLAGGDEGHTKDDSANNFQVGCASWQTACTVRSLWDHLVIGAEMQRPAACLEVGGGTNSPHRKQP